MPKLASARDVRQHVFLARQPILDRSGRVRAYELLYRNGDTDATSAASAPDVATARVLHGAVMNFGLETLTSECPAFLNVTRHMLTRDLGSLLPPSNVVLEVVESIDVDDEVLHACRDLHGKGYTLALDDFTPRSSAERLLPYAQYVKVDVLALDADARTRLLKNLPKHVQRLAEKVETSEMFSQTAAEGFDLFQGYYFCRPSMVKTADISAQQAVGLRLLEALNKPRVTIAELDDLIKRDASLCHRVLRYVNSAALGISRPVHSIRQAIMLIGLEPIRKWASIWSLAALSNVTTPEVMTMAVVRGRACERFGATVVGADASGELFLLGLCSLLDIMLNRPMAHVLRAVSLPDRITDALLGGRNLERDLLDAVVLYERAEWDDVSAACWRIGARTADLSAAFADALRWSRSVSE